MEYSKRKLKKKIKFSKKGLVGEKHEMDEPEGEVELMEGSAKNAVESGMNLRKGIDFYYKNMDMPDSKKLLRNKRDRYIKALKKLRKK